MAPRFVADAEPLRGLSRGTVEDPSGAGRYVEAEYDPATWQVVTADADPGGPRTRRDIPRPWATPCYGCAELR
ncbi:MAG: hypothetical protein ACT4O0_10710 [Pseudonocardia sp.]